jgi:hypothetical protein
VYRPAGRRLRRLALECDELWGDVPRQQFLNAVDGMLADALEHMTQVGGRIDTVEKTGSDQAVDIGRALPAGIRTSEQKIVPREYQRSDGALCRIVIDLDASVITDRPAAGPGPPAVWYRYSSDRKAEHPQRHLHGFRGILA